MQPVSPTPRFIVEESEEPTLVDSLAELREAKDELNIVAGKVLRLSQKVDALVNRMQYNQVRMKEIEKKIFSLESKFLYSLNK